MQTQHLQLVVEGGKPVANSTFATVSAGHQVPSGVDGQDRNKQFRNPGPTRQSKTQQEEAQIPAAEPEAPMVDKDYVDAKVGEMRAQNDARFAEVISKLDVASVKMTAASEHMPTTSGMIASAAGAVVATVGLIVAIWAFAGDRFDGGMSAASVSVQQAVEAQNLATENAAKMKEIQGDLDTIIKLLGEKAKQ